MHVVGVAVGVSVGVVFFLAAIGTIIYIRCVWLAQRRERKRQHEAHLEEMRAVATLPLYTYANDEELALDTYAIDPELAEVPGNAIVDGPRAVMRAHEARQKKENGGDGSERADDHGSCSSENGIQSEFVSVEEIGGDEGPGTTRVAAAAEDEERAFAEPFGEQQAAEHDRHHRGHPSGEEADGLEGSDTSHSASLRAKQQGGNIIVHIKDGTNGEDRTKIYRRQNSGERYGRAAYYVSSPHENVPYGSGSA